MAKNSFVGEVTFNVKQLKMSKVIKSIWQLVISTSNPTLQVPLLCPCMCIYIIIKNKKTQGE